MARRRLITAEAVIIAYLHMHIYITKKTTKLSRFCIAVILSFTRANAVAPRRGANSE